MKHLDLIKLVSKNADIIDRAYRHEHIQNIEEELIDSTLFIKINNRYKLNKNYLNFVDSVLQRVDYSIIFGDYEKEYKELVKLKKRYLETQNDFYKKGIERLIENLYEKFYNRDREIQILLLRLENDTSLEIDILLENATDTLEKIYELIGANEKVGHFFRKDLRGLESGIDSLLQSIGQNILKYIQNIDEYIDKINRFIVQTKKRRLQNRQVMQVANMILQEDTNALDESLQLSCKKLYFTQARSQKNRVSIYPDDKDIIKLKKELKKILENLDVKPTKKEGSIKPQAQEKLDIVNIENILKDLRFAKSDDVFMFVKEHNELTRFKERELIEESFKIYLYLTTKREISFKSMFNDYDIKVAVWE
ncbi:MAG: hypothetical protein QM497_07905 [Sulfurimonas sp.]